MSRAIVFASLRNDLDETGTFYAEFETFLFFFSRFFFPLETTIQTPRYSRSKLVIAVIAVFRHDRRD